MGVTGPCSGSILISIILISSSLIIVAGRQLLALLYPGKFMR